MTKKFNIPKNYLIIAAVLIIILLIWGLIGGNIAKDIGNTCTVGVTEFFCWFWEKNLVGEISDAASKLFD